MFILEDGTGIENANAYITILECKAYWTDRSIDYTGLTDAQIQTAIINATQFIDGRYSFKGFPTTVIQGLMFPRSNGGAIKDTKYNRTVAVNVIPTTLKNATCEIAGVALADIVDGNSGSVMSSPEIIKSKKYGPVAIVFGNSGNGSKNGGSGSATFVDYPSATKFIKGMLITSGILRR